MVSENHGFSIFHTDGLYFSFHTDGLEESRNNLSYTETFPWSRIIELANFYLP